MRLSAAIIVAGVVGIAQAQTPQGFKPAVNTNLELLFNTTKVTKPGEMLTKAGMSALRPSFNFLSSIIAAHYHANHFQQRLPPNHSSLFPKQMSALQTLMSSSCSTSTSQDKGEMLRVAPSCTP